MYLFHHRGHGLGDGEAFRKLVNARRPSIDVRLRNWYPEN